MCSISLRAEISQKVFSETPSDLGSSLIFYKGNNLLGGSVHTLVYGTISTLSNGADLLHLVDPTEAEQLLHGIVHM
jgi:hypothetical protein